MEAGKADLPCALHKFRLDSAVIIEVMADHNIEEPLRSVHHKLWEAVELHHRCYQSEGHAMHFVEYYTVETRVIQRNNRVLRLGVWHTPVRLLQIICASLQDMECSIPGFGKHAGDAGR